jgi:hypothetical protein
VAPQSTQSNRPDFFAGTCTCVTLWAKPHFGQAKITVVIIFNLARVLSLFVAPRDFGPAPGYPSVGCQLVHSGHGGPENFAVN